MLVDEMTNLDYAFRYRVRVNDENGFRYINSITGIYGNDHPDGEHYTIMLHAYYDKVNFKEKSYCEVINYTHGSFEVEKLLGKNKYNEFVYANDIVWFLHPLPQYGIVEYQKYAIKYSNFDMCYYLYDMENDTHIHLKMDMVLNCSVIGNIHGIQE